MNLVVVGTGYVGLVSGTCFSEMGNKVTCVDIDTDKIKKIKEGIIPIYEPRLEAMVLKNIKNGNLNFSTDLEENIKNADVVFIDVGLPVHTCEGNHSQSCSRTYGHCYRHRKNSRSGRSRSGFGQNGGPPTTHLT